MSLANGAAEALLKAQIGRNGALFDVELTLTEYETYRRQAGLAQLPLPFPQRGYGMIDTGAEASVISAEVAEALELETIRTVPVVTVHGEQLAAVCAVRVILGWNQRPQPLPIEVNAIRRPLGVVHLLAGRDILRYGHIEWDGPQSVAHLRLPTAD